MAAKAPPKPGISLAQDLRAFPWLLPFFVVFAVFIAYPLVYSFWISMHRVTIYSDFYNVFGSMEFVGLDNYRILLTDVVFWWSVFLVFVYAALTIFPGIALSLTLALLLNRKIRGLAFMRGGFYLPNVFDIYIVGVIWLLIYNPNGGIVSYLLAQLGLTDLASEGILANPYTTLPAIALTMVLKNAGFGMILFLVSLNTMNQSVFEAAEVDGASPAQKLVHIIIPMLKPIIFFLTITGLIGALNAFSEIYAMTDDTGGTSVMQVGGATLTSARISGYHLYKVFDQSMYGMAAAISFFLLFFALVVSMINLLIIRPRD